MKDSKYLNRFKSIDKPFLLYGDTLIVERIPVEEKKTASGLFVGIETKNQINTLASERPMFVRVLSVGVGFYDDDGNEVKVDAEPGNIILVGDNSVKWFSDMDIKDYQPYEIGFTRESEIKLKFNSKEDYESTFEGLSKNV